jgi:hypothetical protein
MNLTGLTGPCSALFHRAVPPRQRFKAEHLAADRIDHRLIDQREFLAFKRVAQRRFKLAARFGVGVERRLVTEMGAAAFVLGPIERQIGIAHQCFDCGAIAWSDGRTDARADVKRVMVDQIGLRQA